LVDSFDWNLTVALCIDVRLSGSSDVTLNRFKPGLLKLWHAWGTECACYFQALISLVLLTLETWLKFLWIKNFN